MSAHARARGQKALSLMNKRTALFNSAFTYPVSRLPLASGLCAGRLWEGEQSRFQSPFELASAVHNYNTRYATNQNLNRSSSRTNYGLAKFCVVASQTWEIIQWNPVKRDTKGTRQSVRIKRFNF